MAKNELTEKQKQDIVFTLARWKHTHGVGYADALIEHFVPAEYFQPAYDLIREWANETK